MPDQKDFSKRAAFLRREEIGATKVSNNFLSEAPDINREIYVFDNGIIDTYLKPWKRGPVKGKTFGLGQILPTLDDLDKAEAANRDVTAERLADILVRHLFERTKGANIQMLATPFHFEEIEREGLYLTNRLRNLGIDQSGYNLRQSIIVRRQLALISHRFKEGNKEAAWDFAKNLAMARFDRKALGFSRDVIAFDRMCRLATEHGATLELNEENLIENLSGFQDHDAIDKVKSSKIFENLSVDISCTESEKNQLPPDSWANIINISQQVMRDVFEKRHSVDKFISKKFNDTSSLSWLFVLNCELVRLKLHRYRIVLVTDDSNLCELAYANLPIYQIHEKIRYDVLTRYPALSSDRQKMVVDRVYDFIRPTYAQSKDVDRERFNASPVNYFSLNYIRHIWAYFSEAIDTGEIGETGDKNFSEIFGEIFSEIGSEQKLQYFKTLEKIAQTGKSNEVYSKPMMIDAINNIQNLSDTMIARQEIIDAKSSENLKNSIFHLIQRHVAASSYDWNSLAASIDEELLRDRDRALVSLSTIGANTLRQSNLFGTRHPPDLIFESLNRTMKIFRNLASKDAYENGEHFLDDFRSIKLDCWSGYYEDQLDPAGQDDLQEVHLKFLVLGAAFASADKWPLALANAKRAIDIIERQRHLGSIKVRSDHKKFQTPADKKSFMSGREAYFLQGVAQRILASTSDEISLARKSIVTAQERLKLDQANHTAKNITPLRFTTEILAINLSHYYLKRFESCKYNISLDELLATNTCDEEFSAACNSLLEIGAALNSNYQIDIFKSNTNLDSIHIGVITRINLSVNIIQLLAIYKFRSLKLVDEIPQYILKSSINALDTLKNIYQKEKNNITITRLTESYFLIGQLICTPEEFSNYESRDKLNKHLEKSKTNCVTVYDRWRYENLCRLTKILYNLIDM